LDLEGKFRESSKTTVVERENALRIGKLFLKELEIDPRM
jgi:hypothetical protein